MNDVKTNISLLPQYIQKPVMLVWAFILPQLILLFINMRAFWIVSEEVLPEYRMTAYSIFAVEVILLILSGAAGLYSRIKRTNVHWGWNLLFLFGQIGYLWLTSSHMWQIIPSQIEPWVLDRGQLTLQQFTFIMPGIFYAALRLACFETKFKPGLDLGVSLLVAVAAPVMYYIFFIALRMFIRFDGFRFSEVPVLLFFIGMTVMTFIGLIRGVVLAYNMIRTKGELAQLIFSVAICLAGPIGGLLLNRTIPFPSDFQSPWIYILAIINGLIVMIPNTRKSDGHSYLLFARAVTFPFSFYFFLVFVPFLPLSLPAIFAVGAGFLILVPVVLWLLHTQRLADDFRIVARTNTVAMAVMLTIGGLSVLPGYFTWEAFKDKASLSAALRYVYAPDYTRDFIFSGSVKSIRRTLINLREFKEGIQMPYLSNFYNSVVFEGMVLPDKKINEMYRLFVGETIPAVSRRPAWDFAGRSNRMRTGNVRAADRQVQLVSTHIQNQDSADETKSRVRLEMVNTGTSDRAEFFREMTVPEGVLISGFSLKVGEEMTPGQIFEKRAAMWVYHMIRDFTRRDPGLLTYQSPSRINLNVYPFALNEKRIVEIEFQFPKDYSPVISIGEQRLILNQKEDTAPLPVVGGTFQKGSFFVLSKDVLSALPKTKRRPYLHFILDISKEGMPDMSAYKERMELVRRQYPSITKARITAAHFESQLLTPDFLDLNNKKTITQAIQKTTLSHQGSLDIGRVIKQELLRYQRGLDQNNWQEYPLFVLISSNAPHAFPASDMEFFSSMLPDCNYYLVSSAAGSLEKLPMWESTEGAKDREVAVFKSGDTVQVIPAAEDMRSIYFDGSRGDGIAVYDSGRQGFTAIDGVQKMAAASSYSQGIGLMHENLRSMVNPSELDQSLSSLVSASRQSGIMIPSTSYIVVERSSQWKTLQLKEKQRLGTSQGLDFDEELRTPAPPLWLLLVLICLISFLRKRKLGALRIVQEGWRLSTWKNSDHL